nr:hypothetical protein [Hymenobacter arizonensis]
MTYAIITGAHFFPYAWFYRTKAFAYMAGVISVGAMLLGLRVGPQELYLIPGFVAGAMVVLSALLVIAYKQNAKLYLEPVSAFSSV